jgi:hypothetical protein
MPRPRGPSVSTTWDNKRIVRDPDVYGGKPYIEGHRSLASPRILERFPIGHCTHRHRFGQRRRS